DETVRASDDDEEDEDEQTKENEINQLVCNFDDDNLLDSNYSIEDDDDENGLESEEISFADCNDQQNNTSTSPGSNLSEQIVLPVSLRDARLDLSLINPQSSSSLSEQYLQQLQQLQQKAESEKKLLIER